MNVRKPLTRSLSNQSIYTYFSNTQIVLGPTYGIFRNLMRQQEHHWKNQCAGECNDQEATLLPRIKMSEISADISAIFRVSGVNEAIFET